MLAAGLERRVWAAGTEITAADTYRPTLGSARSGPATDHPERGVSIAAKLLPEAAVTACREGLPPIAIGALARRGVGVGDEILPRRTFGQTFLVLDHRPCVDVVERESSRVAVTNHPTTEATATPENTTLFRI